MEQQPLFEPPVYEIRTVADFLKVPAERRAVCLSEFGTWLKIHDPLITLLTPTEFPGCVQFMGVFRWIDDGKRNVSVSLHVVDKDGNTLADDAVAAPRARTSRPRATKATRFGSRV